MPSDQQSTDTPVETRRLRRGDVLELVMEKTADRGKCLAYHNGQVVFVPHTLAGRARPGKSRQTKPEVCRGASSIHT